MKKIDIKDLRSRKWFMNPDNPEMTALYLERYLNYGLTRQELQSGKPHDEDMIPGETIQKLKHLHIKRDLFNYFSLAGGSPIWRVSRQRTATWRDHPKFVNS